MGRSTDTTRGNRGVVLDETRREDNVGGERGGISVESWQNRNKMLNQRKEKKRKQPTRRMEDGIKSKRGRE